MIHKIWGHGFCTTSELTLNSAAYVARYCMKKVNGDKANEHYQTTNPLTGEIWHFGIGECDELVFIVHLGLVHAASGPCD